MASSSRDPQCTDSMVHRAVQISTSVAEALKRLAKTDEPQEYIFSKREMQSIFGKINSDLYWAILKKRISNAKLNREA